ncbi:MAG TPA: ABC transporter ATP-binding protein [Candidatus Saccharimonadales bacterium]|nr:ABC transporter ATP-binding protein [Candidatus Saccharimonadales bacterium]
MNKILLRTLLNICKEYRWALAFFLVAGISQTFLGLYAISYFQRLIDGLTRARQFEDVKWVLFGYIALTLGNHALIYLGGYPSSLLNNGAYQSAKLSAMKKIARIDYLAYQNLGTGQLVQIIENGANATKSILNNFYLNLIRGMLPSVLISFAFIHYYDPALLVIILGAYAILFFASYYLMNYLRRAVDRMLANQEDFSKFSTRGFMELVVFRVNGRFQKEFERVKSLSDEYVRSRAKIYLVQELFFTGFAVLVFGLEIVMVVQQTNRILAGVSTVGTLVALVAFIKTVCSPISEFSYAYATYKLDTVAFNRFGAFMSLPEDAGLAKGERIHLDRGRIEFRDVSFSFQNKPVLSNLSLTLEAGKTTALVGTSGGGKSTIVRLLLQLLKPVAGQVLVDGRDLSQVNLESFYRQVAYIPQDPPIFDGSLRENLTFNERVNDSYLQEVLEKVGLDSLISQLPAGLETIVGERGVKLSGGERQRLAFGRVFIQDPKIVIMDEPTSALDSITESFITKNMTHLFKGKTVIIIAHRLQSVKDADQIFVLEKGKIIQQGSFETLAQTEGKFRQLWETQTTRRAGILAPLQENPT